MTARFGGLVMLVSHILDAKGRDVVTIAPEKTLSDALHTLSQRKIGALVVRRGAGDVVGIISERDVVQALSADGSPALAQPVTRYMTEAVCTCAETDTIDDLMERMTEGRFRHVPVVEGGALKGIVSIGDVVKSRIDDAVRETHALKEYIRG